MVIRRNSLNKPEAGLSGLSYCLAGGQGPVFFLLPGQKKYLYVLGVRFSFRNPEPPGQ